MDDLDAVLVAGASGGTGGAVLAHLADRPIHVKATTRSTERVPELASLGADEVVVGDLLDPDTASNAVTGVDAVLSAVGTSPLAVRSGEPYVDGQGNITLVEAAEDAAVEAFVMVSALGVGDEPSSWLGSMFNLAVGPVQRAKAEAEAAARASPLRHTILRAGALTRLSRSDDPVVAEPGAKLWGPVSRRAVGCLVAAAPTTEAAAERTFEVVSNPLLTGPSADVEWALPSGD